MRLRRLCEYKDKRKKCHVDQKTHEMWKGGGEGREWLEIALTETLEKMGACQKNQHKKLRVTWLPFSYRFYSIHQQTVLPSLYF